MPRKRIPKRLYSIKDLSRALGVGMPTISTWHTRKTAGRLVEPDFTFGIHQRPLWTREHFEQILRIHQSQEPNEQRSA